MVYLYGQVVSLNNQEHFLIFEDGNIGQPLFLLVPYELRRLCNQLGYDLVKRDDETNANRETK